MHKKVIKVDVESRTADTEMEEDCQEVVELFEDHRLEATKPSNDVSVVEYHVVWHCSYSVPVLYFRAYKSGNYFN
jgi:hypothetical protein